MIKSGLTSITFRQLSVEKIIELVVEAGLDSIEWGGDVHVPHGDIDKAKHVRHMCENAGIELSSYGSYYCVGLSDQRGLDFRSVVDSCVALNVPIVRVWAGNQEAEPSDNSYFEYIADETRRISQLAAQAGVKIAFEYHRGTLTNTAESTCRLLSMIDDGNVSTYWQPIHGRAVKDNCSDIMRLLGYISNIHVFHWWPDHTRRHLLADGVDKWGEYFKILRKSEQNSFALIEFVKDDLPENFRADAKTVKKLLEDTHRS